MMKVSRLLFHAGAIGHGSHAKDMRLQEPRKRFDQLLDLPVTQLNPNPQSLNPKP